MRTTSKLYLSVVLALGLSACGGDRSLEDLENWVAIQRAQSPGRPLEPLPEVTPYVPVRYSGVGLKDPFAPSSWTESLDSVPPLIAVQDCRDPQRPREELERYSLGALKLVGSFRAPGDDALWALIQAPDGIVHRLGKDDYLGANHGRVVRIREGGLEMVECVADPDGGWEERQASLRLSG